MFWEAKHPAMEKYAVVKEKLKKLSAEQTRGDSYDPFLPAQKEARNAYSKQPQNRSPEGEQLAFDVESANPYPAPETAFSVARAIDNLQHRSHQGEQVSEVANPARPDQPFVTEPANYEDDLIVQEIQRLERRAININNRSQQQAEDILALKRAAQQAAIAFARQGIHDHPQLDVINRFFDRYSASHVPIIERDDCGHFTLGDYSINLRRAEEEAIENAAVLRGDRHPEALPSVPPFSQPISGRRLHKQSIQPASGIARAQRQTKSGSLTRLQTQMGNAVSGLEALWTSLCSMQASASSRPISQRLATEQSIANYSRNREFSFVDGAIWFSAAAIVARLVLKTLVSVFPIFQPILLLAPLGLFCAATYLLFVAKSANSTLMYRLVLVALGLFLSGSL